MAVTFFVHTHPWLLLLMRILQFCCTLVVGIGLIVTIAMSWGVNEVSIQIAGMYGSHLSIRNLLASDILKSHRLILFLVASTVATLCLVSISSVLVAFPSLMTRLLHQNHKVKLLVNILRISLEVTLLTLWLLTCIYFVIKTGRLDLVNKTAGSAPIEIWNMGILLSVAETYDYTPRSIQFSPITQEYCILTFLI